VSKIACYIEQTATKLYKNNAKNNHYK